MPSTITPILTPHTLTTMRAVVLQKLRQLDTSRYSPTKGTADYDWIDAAINDAQWSFVMDTKCLKGYGIIDLKTGYRTYRMPTEFIDLAAAYFYRDDLDNGYIELSLNNIEEMNDEFADYRTKQDATPSHLYVDRKVGPYSIVGAYPIPNFDSPSVPFTANTAAIYDWVCPVYAFSKDFGTVIKTDGDTKYILPNTDARITGDLEPANNVLVFEYYRLPIEVQEATQEIDIPHIHQDTVITMAVSALLENNPEDSVEYKRSLSMGQKGQQKVREFIKTQKRVFTGQELRVRAASWSWQSNMDYRKEMW